MPAMLAMLWHVPSRVPARGNQMGFRLRLVHTPRHATPHHTTPRHVTSRRCPPSAARARGTVARGVACALGGWLDGHVEGNILGLSLAAPYPTTPLPPPHGAAYYLLTCTTCSSPFPNQEVSPTWAAMRLPTRVTSTPRVHADRRLVRVLWPLRPTRRALECQTIACTYLLSLCSAWARSHGVTSCCSQAFAWSSSNEM